MQSQDGLQNSDVIHHQAPGRALYTRVGLVLLLTVAYLAVGRLSLLFSALPGHISFLWLPAGIALAALLLGGIRLAPGVALGAFAVHYSAGSSLFIALAAATGATLSAVAGAWLLQRKLGFSRALDHPRHVLSLTGVGAFAAPIICATVVVAAAHASGLIPRSDLAVAWAVCWAGNALGILLVTPVLLSWPHRQVPPAKRAAPLVALVLLQLLVSTFVFALKAGPGGGAYVYLALALVSATYLPFTWVTVVNLLTFTAAAAGTLLGTGPFPEAAFSGLTNLQTYGIVSSLATLLVSSLAHERETVAAELRDTLERFQQLTALSSDWYWEQDENLRFTHIAGRAVEEERLLARDIIGRTRWDIDARGVSDEMRQAHDAAVDARLPFSDLVMTRFNMGPEPRVVAVSGAPIFDQQRRFRGYRGVARDITLQTRAEREIEEAKGFLDALIDAIPTPVLVKDENHRFIAANAAFCRFFGNQADAILGKTDYDFFSADAAAYFQKTDNQALTGAIAVEYDRPYTIGDHTRWMMVRKSALARPDGSRVVVVLLTDVTERREAEDQIRASEGRFRALTQLSSDWYWEQDDQFRFTRIAGTSNHPIVAQLQQYIGSTSWGLPGHDQDEARWSEHRAQLVAQQSFRDQELACRLDNGDLVYMSINGEPVFDPDGSFLGYRGTATDITERKLAQQRIARLKDMYAAMSEANSAIIHSHSPEELFAAICRIAVENVHFMYVSVALVDAQTGGTKTVAGAGRAHSDRPGEPARDVVPDEQQISQHALRTGMNMVYNDILAEPRARAWRDKLTELGISSLATLLLRRQGRVAGILHLYAAQAGFFDEELVGLLEKLAMNLSFSLDNFHREQARRAAESALRESETRFRDFADAAGEYVWETDLEGRFTYVSSRVQSVWGYSDQELIGRTAQELMPSGEAERVGEWLRHHQAQDSSFRDLEHMIVNRQGDTRWLLINAVSVFGASGELTGRRGTGRDITDRKAAEARIRYLATRDPLTELPNRVLFNDRLEHGIVAARRTGQSLGLLFVDLDRFKNINDSLGHQVGDLLLQEVANRMQGSVRKGDTVSRLGGDEFVVTLEGLQQAEDAAQVASKIIKSLSRPIEIAGHTLNTSCSIGISIFPLDADDDRALMKNADTAMYHAKENGRNNYQFFSPEMNVRAVERHSLETALRQAIERQEFTLHYQPLVSIGSGKVVGVEALLRWQHPDRGLLSPATFIAVAEESGLIEPIGQWVLRAACERAKAWLDAGYAPLKMAVNISTRQLLRPKEFPRAISQLLAATGLEPRYLELEMTESLLVQNAEDNIAVLRKLGQDGVRIAVDDFGTGYSSLSYLRQLPIHTLKIDRSFVRDIEADPEDMVIIQAIVAMAHSLGLQVTAEGVETRGQLAALARLGCDEYQGYLFSRPLPAVEIAARFLAPRELEFDPNPTASAPLPELGKL